MFPGRTTPALLILFAPLGLSLTCSNTTNTTEWSVSAICWDTLISHGNCHWYVADGKTGLRVEDRFGSSSDRSHFYCSKKFQLPPSAGEYVYYIFHLNVWTVAFLLQIDDPGEPSVRNCKNEVLEGETVRCVCSTQYEGKPPPVISWKGQGTSPVLLLYTVRHTKTYKCQMVWGNRTKTVSYVLYVQTHSPVSVGPTTTAGIDDVENEENNNSSSLSTSIIGAAAAAVLVLIITITVIVIIIIRRRKILSQSTGSSSGHIKEELVEITNDGRNESNMVCDNYAEVTDVVRQEENSTEYVVYVNTRTREDKQTVEATLYGNVEISKGREATQVDVYAVVEKNKDKQPVQPELYTFVDKQHLKAESSGFQCERESSREGDLYAVVNKGTNTSSRALSPPVEEMYAQVVKPPK